MSTPATVPPSGKSRTVHPLGASSSSAWPTCRLADFGYGVVYHLFVPEILKKVTVNFLADFHSDLDDLGPELPPGGRSEVSIILRAPDMPQGKRPMRSRGLSPW